MFEAPVPGYQLLARLMAMHQQAQQGGFGMMTQPAGMPPQAPMPGPGGLPLTMPPNGQLAPPTLSPLLTAIGGRMPLQGQ